jgi:hypothetical protein
MVDDFKLDDDGDMAIADAGHDEEEIAEADANIVRFDQFSTAGNAVYSVLMGPVLWKVLKHYNCFYKKKFPHHLLAESREVRLKLLAGVVDGDGWCCHEKRYIEVAAKKRGFIDGLIHLARGLGFSTGKVGTKTCTVEETGKTYTGFRVFITGAELPIIPTVLMYKRFALAAVDPNKDQRCDGFSIKKVGHGKYFGFRLDGNGRCLLDDFVVTHNVSRVRIEGRQGSCDCQDSPAHDRSVAPCGTRRT